MKLNKWGRCTWSHEYEKEKIHSEDIDNFKSIYGPFVVFKCVSIEGEYIVIKYGNSTYRVKPEIFREVKEPKYEIGDTIKINNTSATILLNEWHNEKMEHYYYVTASGKRKSRRYFESELNSVYERR